MKYSFVIFTLLLSVVGFTQTGSLKGTLYDREEKEVFPFASVVLEEGLGAVTDVNGEFYIDNIPFGTYGIKILHPAYGRFKDSIAATVKIKEDSTTTVYIEFPSPCTYSEENNSCPKCHKDDEVIPIIYGYPGEKLIKMAEKGKAILGGCVVSYCDPQWYCKRDEVRF